MHRCKAVRCDTVEGRVIGRGLVGLVLSSKPNFLNIKAKHFKRLSDLGGGGGH